MADPYNLDLTAAQINTALNNAHDSDKAPASGHANLVNSNKIHEFVTSQVGNEASAREAADTALESRIDDLEAVPVWARFTRSFQNIVTGVFSGYTEEDTSNIASASSGVITITGAGVYQVMFSLNFQVNHSVNASRSFDLQFRVNSESVGGYLVNSVSFGAYAASPSYAGVVVSSGSFTLDSRVVVNNMGTASVSDISITVLKIS